VASQYSLMKAKSPKNEKFIPLDKETGQPHECSEEKEEEKVEEV
jgi:hypothetical protein